MTTSADLRFDLARPGDEPLLLAFIQALDDQEGIPYDHEQAGKALGPVLDGPAIAFAAEEARRRGMARMRLEVERHNPARALYERHGFVAHDRDPMTRDLAP